MRQIKFRAWNNIIGQMIPFRHIKDWPIGDFIDGKTYSLMQYTTINDKNNKEIYDGDIVDFRSQNYTIKWCDGHSNIGEHDDQWGMALGWYLHKPTTKKLEYDEWIELCSDMLIEVVGNIYQNKELVK